MNLATTMFSSYQQTIFEWAKNGSGNAIVQARAGSGKTFTALHTMQYLRGHVISMVFNKKNADELKEKITQMGLINAKAATFHSEGFLNYKNARGFVKVNNSKVFFLSEKYLTKSYQLPARSFVVKAVSLAKQNGIGIKEICPISDHKAWTDIIAHHDISLDADMSWEEAIDICQEVLKDSNRDFRNIDFDDMIYLPILNEQEFIKYDTVIIDEAQDTNVVRKLMAARMIADGGRFLAIGDDAQAIYGFTGADNDSMEIIKNTFNCAEFSLPICYRCGTNIIKEAQNFKEDIIAKEGAKEGTVSSVKYSEFTTETERYKLNREDGIVCRNNAPLVALAFNLIRQGIGCRIEGRDIGKSLITLTNKWKCNNLSLFSEKLFKYFSQEFDKSQNRAKLQLLEDKMETMIILIERCNNLGMTDVKSLRTLIEGMFSDKGDKDTPNVVTLSSIHKSKGLEFDRCFILGDSQFSPSKYAILEWQIEQEKNLQYVARTRAKEELIYINECPSRRNQQEKDHEN